jgi:arabinogalactan endo-1,4-beta-galactosidase
MQNSGCVVDNYGNGYGLRLNPWGIAAVLFVFCCIDFSQAQQPTEPVDPSPINGETYYFINQLSNMQMDLNSNSTTNGDSILQNPVNFTSLSQRWAMTKAPSGNWKINNIFNGLCLDSATASGVAAAVQNSCGINLATQEWTFTYTSNGYNLILNASTGYALDVVGSSTAAGAHLNQSPPSNNPDQSQQWLFRPAFFRGNDNSIQEKQEAERVAGGYPWWQDAGQYQDLLQIMKNHGFNLVRIRPTSIPPYQTYTLTSSNVTPATCTGNGCYAETDAAGLDLAKRAKQLGMSVELSLFFDGGSSTASPGAWKGFTVAETQTAIYNYVKAEIESYRGAGVMPDIVAIGNEVDTGFLSSLKGSPSGAANSANFLNFSAYETAGMQAVADAASDTTLGPAIPPPLRCIHITPAWDLTSFFSEVNTDNVPYDAICQSYYPIYHGPLTTAQATASNPNAKPIEQTALTNAANSIGKPIFLIEIGEHYESGFDANDPWYPATPSGQRQYVLDVESVLKGLPSNLAMGIDYWDGGGTNIPKAGGGYTAGDGLTDATFVWSGLTLFDNADTSGSTQVTVPTYNAVLPALSAVGGKLDASLAYKLVNANDGRILETAAALTTSGASLDTGLDTGVTSLHQQWQISSNNDGYFQVANLNPASPVNVLDTNGATGTNSPVLQTSSAANTPSQEWDVVTAGNGYFTIVNKSSGLVLGTAPNNLGGSADVIQQQAPASTNADWILPASKSQMWQIVPVHIIAPSTPAELVFDPGTLSAINPGANPGTVNVDIENSAEALIGSTSNPVTLTITGPGGFSQTATVTSSGGVAGFALSNVVLNTPGTYSLSASSPRLTTATRSLTVTPLAATTTTLTSAPTSVMGTNLTFTATVIATSGAPEPTGAVTFRDGAAALGSGMLSSSGVASYVTSTLAVGSHSITGSYAGDTNDAASVSNAVAVMVTPPPDFTISLSPTSATISRGSSATSIVSVTPVNAFNASISLACSGLPIYATCALSSTHVTPAGGTVTSTLTIATNTQVALTSTERRSTEQTESQLVAGLAGSCAVPALLFWPGLFRGKRGGLRALRVICLSMIAMQAISGCGSAATKNSIEQYAITITATSGTLAHSATFQLTVQ